MADAIQPWQCLAARSIQRWLRQAPRKTGGPPSVPGQRLSAGPCTASPAHTRRMTDSDSGSVLKRRS